MKKQRRKTKKLLQALELAERLWGIDSKKWWESHRTEQSLYDALTACQYKWDLVAWRLDEPTWVRKFKHDE